MHKGTYRYPTENLIAPFRHLTQRQIAALFNVHQTTVLEWFEPGATFNQWNADRYAIAIGCHPGEIWADWFDIELVNSSTK